MMECFQKTLKYFWMGLIDFINFECFDYTKNLNSNLFDLIKENYFFNSKNYLNEFN